jgi:hypothetical protein
MIGTHTLAQDRFNCQKSQITMNVQDMNSRGFARLWHQFTKTVEVYACRRSTKEKSCQMMKN